MDETHLAASRRELIVNVDRLQRLGARDQLAAVEPEFWAIIQTLVRTKVCRHFNETNFEHLDSLNLFCPPVEDSPAGNIPLVDYAARVEVAEDALLVLRCHDAENLDNEKYLIFQRLRTRHLAKFETVTDNVLVGDH